MKKEFAARITQLREEKGVSARDMSLSLGLSATYINRIENGRMMPSMPVFFELCEYFAITPAEFFAEEKPSAGAIAAAKKIDALDEDTRRSVLTVINALQNKSEK